MTIHTIDDRRPLTDQILTWTHVLAAEALVGMSGGLSLDSITLKVPAPDRMHRHARWNDSYASPKVIAASCAAGPAAARAHLEGAAQGVYLLVEPAEQFARTTAASLLDGTGTTVDDAFWQDATLTAQLEVTYRWEGITRLAHALADDPEHHMTAHQITDLTGTLNPAPSLGPDEGGAL